MKNLYFSNLETVTKKWREAELKNLAFIESIMKVDIYICFAQRILRIIHRLCRILLGMETKTRISQKCILISGGNEGKIDTYLEKKTVRL